MTIFKVPTNRKPSNATRKKLRAKTSRIGAALDLDKWYIREVFFSISCEMKQTRFLFSSSDNTVNNAIEKITQMFRHAPFQKAVKNRTALRRMKELCTLKRVVSPAPHPILINPCVKVGKVGCGKGASQLFVTEL